MQKEVGKNHQNIEFDFHGKVISFARSTQFHWIAICISKSLLNFFSIYFYASLFFFAKAAQTPLSTEWINFAMSFSDDSSSVASLHPYSLAGFYLFRYKLRADCLLVFYVICSLLTHLHSPIRTRYALNVLGQGAHIAVKDAMLWAN